MVAFWFKAARVVKTALNMCNLPHLSRLFVIALLYAGGNVVYAQVGCTPHANCNDPLPPLNLSGTWTEKSTSGTVISTWNITATTTVDAVGDLTGSVTVNPVAAGCPSVQYTIVSDDSYITSSAAEDGNEGQTTFTATVTNPTPSGACGGYTPVPSKTVEGTFTNKNNDNSSGSFSDGTQFAPSGPTLFVRSQSGIEPTGETITRLGPDPVSQTKWNFSQTLTGASGTNIFYGRQVYETASGMSNDGCFNASSKSYPGGVFAVSGSAWNVGYTSGAPSGYSPDTIGYPIGAVQWYRQNIPTHLPCTATLGQAMWVISTNGTNPSASSQYATHSLRATIGSYYVSTFKDGLGGTINK